MGLDGISNFLIPQAILEFEMEIIKHFKNFDLILSKIPVTYELLISLTLIFFIAFLLILITKRKVEFIPLYIFTGIIIGPLALGLIKNTELIHLLGEIGVAFLLFVAGMEMSLHKLRDTSKDSLKIGLAEVVLIFGLTFLAFLFLSNFTLIDKIYIAFILALSSTVVIVKVMSDKRELNTLHARILLSILILQDIFAILFLTIFKQKTFDIGIFFGILSFLFLIALTFLFKRFIINKLLDFASENHETLLLFSLALLFLFSMLASLFGLSVVIGAFLAGLALADSNYKVEIEGRIKPLRDFFALIFFVALGMQLIVPNFKAIILPTLIALIIIFVIKPIAIYLLSERIGYKKTTSFAIALPLANLSEFGLIIAVQGLYLQHINKEVFSFIVLNTIIALAISPYFIKNHYKIYKKFSNFLLLKIGNEKKLEYKSPQKEKILLIGCHRMGSMLLDRLKGVKNKIFVIDHNPDIIKALIKKKITCIYGDASNTEVLERVNWRDMEIVISTIPSFDINEFIIKYAKSKNKDIFVIVTAEKIHDALAFYKKGADYVLVPQTLAGKFASVLVKDILTNPNFKSELQKLKEKQIKNFEKLHGLLY